MLFIVQGVLHWVAEASPGLNPLTVEVRLFDKLFLSEVGKQESHKFLLMFLLRKLFLSSYEISYYCIRIPPNSMIGLVI